MKVWTDIFSRTNGAIFLIAGLSLSYVDLVKKSNQRIRFLTDQNELLKKQQLEASIGKLPVSQRLSPCQEDACCVHALAKQILNESTNAPKI